MGTLAACSWPATRDVRTVDPSADGRRSAASRTDVGASEGGHRLAARPHSVSNLYYGENVNGRGYVVNVNVCSEHTN